MNKLCYEQIKHKSQQEIMAMPEYQAARQKEIAILHAKGNEYQKLFNELFCKYFVLRLEHAYKMEKSRALVLSLSGGMKYLYNEMLELDQQLQD